jgi:hypothetical protein
MTWDWAIVEYLLVDEFQFDQIINLDFVNSMVILALGKSLDFLLYCC